MKSYKMFILLIVCLFSELLAQPVSSTILVPEGIKANVFYREFSQIFCNVPGLYYSELGGGDGDGQIFLRGFDERNIGFTINGIPLNNPETGDVYWSDWLGLSEVLEQVNIERGMSANQFFSPYAGGSINVKTYDGVSDILQPEIVATYGSDNFFRTSILLKQTLIKDKINVTALLSRKVWDGYAEQTWLREWTYYLALTGMFGNHNIGLNLFASPQKHGQRINPHIEADYERYSAEKNYNSDWGYLNGNALNSTESHSHRPLISLNHDWKISEDFSMSNIFYTTFGKGRNTNGLIDPNINTIEFFVPYGFPYDDNGQFDFDNIWNGNLNNIDSTYDPYLSRSLRIISADNFDYFWFGYLLNGKYLLNKEMTFNIGIEYKNYSGGHYGSVENLLGGDYFLDLSDMNATRASDLLKYEDD
ncbi:MAG: TonB-dependent receptor plug domain-containing protein, partial [Ignavibacteriales bacterium]|nr:TonB-dependent receptor plug domain-containing protein [Ignavibacteriales bacterium]